MIFGNELKGAIIKLISKQDFTFVPADFDVSKFNVTIPAVSELPQEYKSIECIDVIFYMERPYNIKAEALFKPEEYKISKIEDKGYYFKVHVACRKVKAIPKEECNKAIFDLITNSPDIIGHIKGYKDVYFNTLRKDLIVHDYPTYDSIFFATDLVDLVKEYDEDLARVIKITADSIKYIRPLAKDFKEILSNKDTTDFIFIAIDMIEKERSRLIKEYDRLRINGRLNGNVRFEMEKIANEIDELSNVIKDLDKLEQSM